MEKVLNNILFPSIDEPFPPSMPKCIEQDRDHIIIGWEPPENDGGNPVQGYIVERKEPKSNRWTPINRGLVKVWYLHIKFSDIHIYTISDVTGIEYVLI